ncbi:MAG TPA: isoaspartyl peptidase/L-asparaginase [Polyangiaceae bacterium]|nr:isoaspartyl peptidase/L-asparaginase [Polyangiaceae bacterium]
MSDIDRGVVTASWGGRGGSWAVLVHGGAGDPPASRGSRHVDGCRAAAAAAAEVLRAGGTALDAVERAVIVLEDDPTFNAGTGACLNEEGRIELDAAIMEGSALRAGGVCALPPFVNPIAIARAVLDDGRHALYAGPGAERFALERGFTRASDEAMTVAAAREQWERARGKRAGENAGSAGSSSGQTAGTVGAVARDARGSVATATSTGGRVNKRVGRVGDSPILGAGTYADDDAGACSATGDGEAILRVCLARGAVDLLRERVHPEEAARAAIRRMGARVGGGGGVILVDRFGQLGLARNTSAMAWAAAGEVLADDGAAGS